MQKPVLGIMSNRSIAPSVGRSTCHNLPRGFVSAPADNLEHVPKKTGMSEHPIFAMPFARVYPHYVAKAERKGRSKSEVDEIIRWLTGYRKDALARHIERETDFRTFFAKAPKMHPHRTLVTGVVCGVRVETVPDPLMREIRVLDKMIDELAKGKAMDKILRTPNRVIERRRN